MCMAVRATRVENRLKSGVMSGQGALCVHLATVLSLKPVSCRKPYRVWFSIPFPKTMGLQAARFA
jgi:hypothetical protein